MKKKLIIDIILFVLMLLEYSRMYIPTILHEIFGLIMLGLVITHLIFNRVYISNIFKTKYNINSLLMLLTNIILIFAFMTTIILGILSSQDALVVTNINNIDVTRLHKILGYVCLIIIGVHLGINFNFMFGKVINIIKNKIVLFVLGIITIALGIFASTKLDYWNHIVGRYGFGIKKTNVFINFIEYFLIAFAVTIVINFIYKSLAKLRTKNSSN